jgi:2,4-dienoyl-CoA reductase-like NADH-dependent reductase (Old Yellow Enzyme family)
MKPMYAPLFEPLVFPNGIRLRNRVAVAPMTKSRMCKGDPGTPACSLTACYAVTEDGKAYPGEPLLTADHLAEKTSRIARTIRQQGAVAVRQLHHGGGVCPPHLVPQGDVVSPSAVATPERSVVTPRELLSKEVDRIIHAFGESTRRAIEAGFDVVELHGAYRLGAYTFLQRCAGTSDDTRVPLMARHEEVGIRRELAPLMVSHSWWR